jgi:hypothetical protein
VLAALAIDPVTPSRVYAVLAGTGIFRSNDGAATWTKISGDLGTPQGAGVLIVDPKTPSRLFVTAAGNGVFRSTDSGVTWTRVKTGSVSDLIMDPSNPDVLYAGLQSDGVYKTRTGGEGGDPAWIKLSGLPASGFVRVTLALSSASTPVLCSAHPCAVGRLAMRSKNSPFEPRVSKCLRLSHKPDARSKARASVASEPRDRSAPAKRRARERVATVSDVKGAHVAAEAGLMTGSCSAARASAARWFGL